MCLSATPFAVAHLACIAAFFVEFDWSYVLLCAALFWVRLFGITGGYHRYFSHRGFKTSRVGQFLLAFLGGTATQKGALWWAGHHRHHHKHSDEIDDVHSPTRDGLWWAHVGWIVDDRADPTRFDLVGDFAKYPELRFLDKMYLFPPLVMAGALLWFGGLPAFVWGFLISTVLLWHATFTINSLSHVFGRRRFETTDTSKNSALLALLTMGEGWHNNHHYWPNTANQGFYWWEVDITYYVLRFLSWFGLVWDLRLPPQKVLDLGMGRAAAAPAAHGEQASEAGIPVMAPLVEPVTVALNAVKDAASAVKDAAISVKDAASGAISRLAEPDAVADR